ncbi:MAG: hypothetical protein IKA85_05525 [Clostridia bacterium]|nr:hypothetical protein [Clostridia bacterium]
MKYPKFDVNLKEEYKKILMENEYGQIPPTPKKVYADKIQECAYLASKVIRTEWRLYIEFEGGETVFFPVVNYFVNGAKNNKTIIHLDFFSELPNRYSPTEEIVERGWNITHVYYDDIVEDNAERNLINDKIFEKLCPDTGKLMIWAWAMMRVFDFISTLPEVDEKNIGIVGHSRLGKTAFLVGAFDERFAFVHVNNSGTSGSAMFEDIPLNEKYNGESIKFITDYNPFWYNKKFLEYIGKEKEMPFDQHLLGYLVAPRPLLIAAGSQDYGSSPLAQFKLCKASSNAYDYYGVKGFIAPDAPTVDEVYFDGKLGYYLRFGIHYLGRTDWDNLLTFFDKNLNK